MKIATSKVKFILIKLFWTFVSAFNHKTMFSGKEIWCIRINILVFKSPKGKISDGLNVILGSVLFGNACLGREMNNSLTFYCKVKFFLYKTFLDIVMDRKLPKLKDWALSNEEKNDWNENMGWKNELWEMWSGKW